MQDHNETGQSADSGTDAANVAALSRPQDEPLQGNVITGSRKPDVLSDMSGRTLCRALGQGEVSAVAVMQATYARIARDNGEVNALVSLLPEAEAMALAQAADQSRQQGDSIGPLHGLPMAVKDLSDVQGFATSRGSALFADAGEKAQRDAPTVQRLRDAGALFIGKTNTPEFGFGSHTFNGVFGLTRNPHDLSRSAGGSSGGAAAALASGMLMLADGSDMGGSLRNPASFCGVVGFRPSVGRVPDFVEYGWSSRIATAGPMARSVDDVSFLLSVMAGPFDDDPLTLDAQGKQFAQRDVVRPASQGSVRLGWTSNFGLYPVQAEVEQVCQQALSRCLQQADGLLTLDEQVPDLRFAAHAPVADAMDVFQIHRRAAVFGLAQALERQFPDWRGRVKDTARWNFEQALSLGFSEFNDAERARTILYQRFVAFFATHDVLVLPTVQVLPFDAAQPWVDEINGEPQATYLDWMSSCCVISVTGLPAISIPVGHSADGLPVGLQIVGPPRGDLKVLQVAARLEQLLKGSA